MGINPIEIPVTTTGGDGVATGSAQTGEITPGELSALFIDYNGMPATTDVIVSDVGGNQLLFSAANLSVDRMVFPRASAVDLNTGASFTAVGDAKYPVRGPIRVSVEDADADAPGVTVTAYLVT